MSVLVTGSAGFIGFHVCQRLLGAGVAVIGIDNHSPYYDPALKAAREARLIADPGYRPLRGSIQTPGLLRDLMARHRPRAVVHLAAQAGVRHSIEAPEAYLSTNLAGTFQLLEAARAHPPAHLLMASSSSVYGGSPDMPYRETDPTDRPVSFYAATKKAAETMAHSYAALYGLPVTALRFFTVYGPWGRPDMAPFLFTRALMENQPIRLFNHGRMRRDFTFVDDLVAAILALVDIVPGRAPRVPGDSLSPAAPFRAVNIGNGAPVALTDFIGSLEAATGRAAELQMLPMQPGDVEATWADTTLLDRLIGPRPRTPVAEGLERYVAWFTAYYPSGRSAPRGRQRTAHPANAA